MVDNQKLDSQIAFNLCSLNCSHIGKSIKFEHYIRGYSAQTQEAVGVIDRFMIFNSRGKTCGYVKIIFSDKRLTDKPIKYWFGDFIEVERIRSIRFKLWGGRFCFVKQHCSSIASAVFL